MTVIIRAVISSNALKICCSNNSQQNNDYEQIFAAVTGIMKAVYSLLQ